MNIKLSVLAISVLLLAGCSSAPKVLSPENQADVVLSRIDNLDSRPGWVKESELFTISGGEVYSIGVTTIPASGNRVEAAFRIAQNSGKAAISSAISSRLSFIMQSAEEGSSIDSTQARYIGAEASELVTSSIRPGRLYWEKVATSNDNGERVTQYKVFAEEKMPETDFKKAILDSIRSRQGKGGLSADFASKVDQHWNKFVNADASSNSLPSGKKDKE